MLLFAFVFAASPAPASHTGCEAPRRAPKVAPRKPAPSRWLPASPHVRLAHGERRTFTVTLHRPASPTPVDVFFLVDTTGSMDSAICGVQRGLSQIAIDLANNGFDARFGLGVYRDYPFAPWGSPDDYAYKRVRPVRPLDDALLRALHELEAGGGGDGLESGLAALYQSATGEGQDVNPSGPSDGDIPPGGQAGFRPEALRLIVNVTDVDFREPSPDEHSPTYGDYPGPPFEDVAEELRRRQIMQAGIAVGGDGRESLERMARSTGAIAPPGGADCDGDKKADLAVGEPLVCDGDPDPRAQANSGGFRPIRMAPAIVSIVKALRDQQPVDFDASGATGVLQSFTPRRSPSVDLKRDQRLPVGLALQCDRRPGRHTIRVGARVRNASIASDIIRVTCDPGPTIVKGVVRAAPPAPVQQPVQQPAPNPNPNPQAQVDPLAQVNGAVAPQVAPEPETALARSWESLERDGTMQASARPVMTTGIAMALAAAALSAGAVATARVPRHPPRPTRRRPPRRRNR